MVPASAPIENSGVFYLTIALLIIVLYFEFFIPDVTEADNEYLRHWAKAEVTLILLLPVAILAAQLALIILSFGYLRPNGFITDLILLIALWYFPSFPVMDSEEFQKYEADFDTVCRAVRRGYFIWKFVLTLTICALTGVGTFEFLKINHNYEYVFPSQRPDLPPSAATVSVKMNEDKTYVDMQRGYLTYFLHNYVYSWIFFIVMFYFAHLHATATFRCIMYYMLFVMNSIFRTFRWIVY